MEQYVIYKNIKIEKEISKHGITNVFVVGYEEDFSDETGAGTFCLLMKQKKDKMAALKFEGGYSA